MGRKMKEWCGANAGASASAGADAICNGVG